MITFRQRYRFARTVGYNPILAVMFAARTWQAVLFACIVGALLGNLLPAAFFHWMYAR